MTLYRNDHVNFFDDLWADKADKLGAGSVHEQRSLGQKIGVEQRGAKFQHEGRETADKSATNTTKSNGRRRLEDLASSPEQPDSDSEEERDSLAVDLRRPPEHGAIHRLAQRLWEKSVRLPCAVSNGALAVLPGGLAQAGGKDALFLVAGGNDKDVLACVWLLDEVGGKWRQVSTLPQACTEHSALWHNGALWVVGGFDGFRSQCPSCSLSSPPSVIALPIRQTVRSSLYLHSPLPFLSCHSCYVCFRYLTASCRPIRGCLPVCLWRDGPLGASSIKPRLSSAFDARIFCHLSADRSPSSGDGGVCRGAARPTGRLGSRSSPFRSRAAGT